MTLVAFVNVVTRYVVRYSLAFTEEVVVSLFVWLTLLGTAIAFREGSHLAFEVLVDRLPAAGRRLWGASVLRRSHGRPGPRHVHSRAVTVVA